MATRASRVATKMRQANNLGLLCEQFCSDAAQSVRLDCPMLGGIVVAAPGGMCIPILRGRRPLTARLPISSGKPKGKVESSKRPVWTGTEQKANYHLI
jgi:hypothetical protein